MHIGLGIDTGGTFTDAALVDLDTRQVLAKAKAPTTYQDLTQGMMQAIEEALANGAIGADQVELVGLSTTLATNSILQGKGGKAGLIGIGWEPQPDWRLGCSESRFVRGGYDSVGRALEPLDEEAVSKAIDDLAGKVDAFVVSGMFSVCNPTQEETVRGMIRERTELPIVVGHTLTSELGIKERTVTAVLNARLIPIIKEFLASVERALSAKGVKGRILVFKGDGGLMTMESARERPVETVLSGPAASLIGGKVLSKVETCVVVDVGGTSTDIAYLDEGFPRLSVEGATVGGWKTRVKAASMWTCGLGGDSLVQPDDRGDIVIGPQRVIPLAIASGMRSDLKQVMIERTETLFYVAGKADLASLNETERKVYEHIVRVGPRTFFELMDDVPEVVLIRDNLESLLARGNVLRTGLTPTDVMHVLGSYTPGDVEAAGIGLRLLAEKMDREPQALARAIMTRAVTRVGEEVLKKVVADEAGDLPGDRPLVQLLHASAGERMFRGMEVKVKLDRPVVGIGAPANDFIGPLRDRMDVQVIIPDHHDVGNAVGAVCSEISESVTLQVYPREEKFIVLSPYSSPTEFHHIEEALASAKCFAESYVRQKVEASGADDVRVRLEVIDRRFSDGYGKEMKFINWIDIRATALGKPRLDKR